MPAGSSDHRAPGSDELTAVLEDSRRWGFLGPGPIEDHVEHAEAFLAAFGVGSPKGLTIDLGSGGGVPGLVLATAWAGSRWVLLDANQRRTQFLLEAVERLHLGDRVTVRAERAETAGRDPVLRGAAELVVARSFAQPPVTAECAAPLLRVGGHLLVSEPPTQKGLRWERDGLSALGLILEEEVQGPPRLVRMRQAEPCPDRFPRRTGVPGKRPLW